MYENKQINTAIAESENVNYYVTISNTDSERPFGIISTVKDDWNDTEQVENIFFTEAEAIACCKWLAENDVFPITLSEVLIDLYTF